MQEAAWVANTGRPRSEETKRKISETCIARKRAAGGPFCEILQRPLFRKDDRWYVFLDGKKIARAKAIYERENGATPRGWVVHHIDGDKDNDCVNNLMAMKRSEHYLLHLYWSAINDWTGKKVPGKKILEKFQNWRCI